MGSTAGGMGSTAEAIGFTVAGTGFTGATAVKFGSTNASSFTVNSATQITATAPAGSASTVHITVTTGSGTSGTGTADQFTYLVPVLPVADFEANVTSGVAPLTVYFSGLSTGSPTLCEWDFGDGSSNMSGFVATHTYNSAGSYTVTMTASNANGSSTAQKVNYITVSSPPVTSFTIPLKAGWNLISLPLVNYSISASSLGPLGVSEVSWYNNSAGGYDTYIVGLTPDDFTLRPDRGYFLYCDYDTSLVVTGDEPTGRSASLSSDWNMVGWSTMSYSDALDVVSSIPGNQEIARYNTSSQGYDTFVEGMTPDAFTVGPGEGYFIYSDVPATLDYGGF